MPKTRTKEGLTHKQTAVLEAASQEGFNRNILKVCRAAHVRRATFYDWYKKDPVFRTAWDTLPQEIAGKHLPGVIAAMVKKATAGDTPAARLLLEFCGELKQRVEHTGADGGPIETRTTERIEQLRDDFFKRIQARTFNGGLSGNGS